MEKIISVSEIIASQLASLDPLYKAENTCERQSMPQQTVLRLSI